MEAVMSASLKGYIPALARLLETTPAALYERQRALVRAGLLAAADGRGPGSGVRATHSAVALLILSILATDRLTESDARVRALASARPEGSERCPCTGQTDFLNALSYVLAASGKAAQVNEITVSRTADRSSIRFNNREHDHALERVFFSAGGSPEPGISVVATLNHNLLQQIASDVHAMALESFNDTEQPR
jgi:hypothetical protein